MKSMKAIVLAATILTLTLGAFPKPASASIAKVVDRTSNDPAPGGYQWILDIIASIPQV